MVCAASVQAARLRSAGERVRVLAAATGGVAAAVAGAAWPLAVLAGVLGMCVVIAVCWVVSSKARTSRAVRLLRAARRDNSIP
jgi:hypothetical protein